MRDIEVLLAQLRQDSATQRLDEDTIHQRITVSWPSIRNEKPMLEELWNKDLLNSDMSFRVP